MRKKHFTKKLFKQMLNIKLDLLRFRMNLIKSTENIIHQFEEYFDTV